VAEYTHRAQCAAWGSGCRTGLLYWETDREITWEDFGKYVESRGWRLDHGRWVCPAHPAPVPTVAEILSLVVSYGSARTAPILEYVRQGNLHHLWEDSSSGTLLEEIRQKLEALAHGQAELG
jgi:hypothetical protein